MSKNVNHIQHVKSNDVVNNKPKAPKASDFLYGEIAINFADGYETMFIKNSNNEIISFSSDEAISGNYVSNSNFETKLGSAFTGANSANTVTKVIEDNERVVSTALNELNETKLNASAMTDYYKKSETSGKTEISTALDGKSNTGHTHDDRYYTESELTGSTTSVVIAKAASATTAATAAVANSVALSNVSGADDIKAIEALTGTSGLLKKTAANTWSLDTTSYTPTSRNVSTASGLTGGGDLTADRTIGLAATGTSGTYGPTADVTGNEGNTIKVPQITTDAYGRVTSITERTYTSKNSTYTVNNGTFTISGAGTAVASTSANASSNTGLNIKAGDHVTVSTGSSEITIAASWPTVNNGTLNLQANGTTKTSFTANQSGNSTFNITSGSTNGTISVGGADVSIKGLGTMAYEAASSYSSATQVNTALEGKSNTGHTHAISDVTNLQTTLNTYPDTATYNSTDKKIYFKHGSTTLTNMTVDATAFIKDGMVSNVEIKNVTSGSSQVTCLVISFNTDAGKENINIPISQIFNADNYYTKADLTGTSAVAVAKATSASTAASANSVALSNVSGADDLKAIEAITGTTGLLKKTAANTWSLDTTSYSSATQVNTALSGKVPTSRKVSTASGLTGGGDLTADRTIGLTATGTSGTYGPTADVTGNEGNTIKIPQITTDAYGRVTSVTERTYTSKNSTYTVNNGTFTISGAGTAVASTSANASSNTGVNIKAGTNVTITTGTNEITIAASQPTVNNGTLNLQANGTTKTSFTANQSGNSTFNITSGSTNGTISVGGVDVSVKGLGTMAYETATNYVATSRKVSTASGLTGGGDLTADRTIGLAATGTAGTYKQVVVDAYGRVTSGNTADNNSWRSIKVNGTNFLTDTSTALNLSGGTNVTLTTGSTGLLTIAATDTTYTFDGTYNSSSNKAATVSSVTTRISAISGSSTGATNKTITAMSQSNGVVTPTYAAISITKSQVSDFPTSMTPTAHNQASNTITAMTSYAKASAAAAIATGDSLNTAIGKLEKAFDGYVPTGRTITTASGLTGGGNLSANKTIGLAATGTSGTYRKVSTDAYGRVTAGTANQYVANLQVADSANYITEPEIKSVKINGSSTNAASTENCVIQYDTINKCLKFTFN